MRSVIGVIGTICLGALLFTGQASAAQAACAFPNQHSMFQLQLFFGQTQKNGEPVPAQTWTNFLQNIITPRFPDGLTVYDTYGQAMDPDTHQITRENTKVVMIATVNTAVTRNRTSQIIEAWKKRANQNSVGLITSTVCAQF
ncbi:MAG TPA: DUF3574 domain-containing protein [Alphaproteobacteria bacterium]|nr:DUF3574 domain-containing protein [Alphaproteobacteria bacterium]